MKKVFYPGPAIPAHMAQSGFYLARNVTLTKGVNELSDEDADYYLALGHVLPVAAESKAKAAEAPAVTKPGAVPAPEPARGTDKS